MKLEAADLMEPRYKIVFVGLCCTSLDFRLLIFVADFVLDFCFLSLKLKNFTFVIPNLRVIILFQDIQSISTYRYK